MPYPKTFRLGNITLLKDKECLGKNILIQEDHAEYENRVDMTQTQSIRVVRLTRRKRRSRRAEGVDRDRKECGFLPTRGYTIQGALGYQGGY